MSGQEVKMSGKLGVKLIPRLSTTKKFHSLRELVFSIFERQPTISKENMEKIVRKEYPKANFFSREGKGGHFTWYKHKWNKEKLEKEFTIVGVEAEDAKEGDDNVGKGYEGEANRKRKLKGMGNKKLARPHSRKKNRRVQVRKNKK